MKVCALFGVWLRSPHVLFGVKATCVDTVGFPRVCVPVYEYRASERALFLVVVA